MALAVCVQKMVRTDLGSSGVAFSIDTESGFKDVILINSSWGLGEMVVGGSIQPDEIIVFKKTLNDGYFTSTFEPFLFLVSEIFEVTIEHCYNGHNQIYENHLPPFIFYLIFSKHFLCRFSKLFKIL